MILRTDNLLAGKLILPFEGRLPAIVLSSAAICLWKSFRRSRTPFRDRPELFGFIPEPVLTFIPESCSRSSRNTVRNHPGIAFTFPRNPQLDQESCGSLYLRMPDIAAIVARAIRQGGQQEYSLHAWVVMPNHVHLLITPRASVSALLQRLKGVTAHAANRALARSGPFGQHESYDRLVREDREFRRIKNYIIMNPVTAGLAASPELYRWSSAWL